MTPHPHPSRSENLASYAQQRAQVLQWLQTQFVPEMAVLLFLPLMTAQVPELGPLLVLAQFGLMALLIAARPVQCLGALTHWWPLLATPIIALASCVWSELPAESARYAMQFFFTCFTGVFLATLVTPSRFLQMSFLGMLGFCVLSILSHRTGPSFHGEVLIGFTGSKNQMGLAGFMLLMAAMATALDNKIHPRIRLLVIPAIPIALYVVASTDTATAVLIAAAAAPLLLLLHISERFHPATRIGLMLAVVLVLSPLALIWNDAVDWATNTLFNSMGKDATLTGRTYLWERAHELIARRPLEGHGYQAFWVGDSADIIGILRWADLQDGRTFNFHNTYLQVAVDTGYLGMGSLVLTLIAIGLGGFRQFVLNPTVATSYFFINFIVLIMISFTEVILLPFLPRTMLLFVCGVYAWKGSVAPRPAKTPEVSWRRRHLWT
ncbi:MAG TPA: O-antigen ligase family protein [Caulobacterales bacterium]|nr:O-antigen ligase family protein [Caulobacterales bacterium]